MCAVCPPVPHPPSEGRFSAWKWHKPRCSTQQLCPSPEGCSQSSAGCRSTAGPPAQPDLPVCAPRPQHLPRLSAVSLSEVIYLDSHALQSRQHLTEGVTLQTLSREGTVSFLLLLSWGRISPGAFPASRQSGVYNSNESVYIAIVYFNLLFFPVIFL